MMRKKKWLAGAAALAAAALIFCIWQNNDLTVSRSKVISERIPTEFDGFIIAQISDLHNKNFGKQQGRLMSKLVETQPDIIVISGDMIDSRRTDVEPALDFARQAVELAPCYYVTGNHENRIPEEYQALKTGLEKAGVTVLENEKVRLERDGAVIKLFGVQDPTFNLYTLAEDEASVMSAQLAALQDGEDGYTILLSHRPELFDVYAAAGVDLVFTGHAHGGQWRLPGIGGLVAPGQGFFPKYTSGAYHAISCGETGSSETTMFVSRGLGNSLMPVRLFNRPEIVAVELCRE